MAWAFDVTSGIPRLSQSGTDTGLGGVATAISAVPTVARGILYNTSQIVKPPVATGFWYKCTTQGTTAGTAPLYATTSGGTTTDGTAVFTAVKAPDVQSLGTGNHYNMPDFRLAINGALTRENPQQEYITCWDVIGYGAACNFISGKWASDGVTPLWDGLHICAVRTSASGADGTTFSLQAGAQFTFIGGEVQLAGGCTFENNTTPRSYLTRWRNTKEWGASSSRFRSYTTNVVFQNVETYDFAFDLFRMPTVPPSIKSRGSEYVYQYVGSLAGGADAKFAASNLENPNGTFDFDNYSGGWVELYNCSKGINLNVVSQYPNNSVWAKHCVPLYQDVEITAKDTAGNAIQDVRFTSTDAPSSPPTVTFTTAGGLKTWDFRTPLSYQTTTNASGVATSTPAFHVWYWQTSFKKDLRFPSGIAVYEGRAFNYKTQNVSATLGSNSAVQVPAGMVVLDTPATVSEATAGGIVSVTFTPSGATGGIWTASANATLRDVWHAYRYFIAQFANRSSNDTWTCINGVIDTGLWTGSVADGVNLSPGTGISKIKSPSITLAGSGKITALYETLVGKSARITLTNLV